MNPWQEELLNLLLEPTKSVESIFSRVERAACGLGFDRVAYGFQSPYPVTQRKVVMLKNYPGPWQARYADAGYLFTDPTVAHGRSSQAPILWTDHAFVSNPALWVDAQDGIRADWAQFCLESNGSRSLLTLCRTADAITALELQAKESSMRWLVQVTHVSLSRAILGNEVQKHAVLTCREREALQWSADGKSAQDIADILNISKGAVDFHLKNAIKKLQTSNKTAAVARAALMGLLG
jgi:DNA-binding CsgD family transcriptional regulator